MSPSITKTQWPQTSFQLFLPRGGPQPRPAGRGGGTIGGPEQGLGTRSWRWGHSDPEGDGGHGGGWGCWELDPAPPEKGAGDGAGQGPPAAPFQRQQEACGHEAMETLPPPYPLRAALSGPRTPATPSPRGSAPVGPRLPGAQPLPAWRGARQQPCSAPIVPNPQPPPMAALPLPLSCSEPHALAPNVEAENKSLALHARGDAITTAPPPSGPAGGGVPRSPFGL